MEDTEWTARGRDLCTLQRVNQKRMPVCADRKTTKVVPFLGSRSFQRRPGVYSLPFGERWTAFAE